MRVGVTKMFDGGDIHGSNSLTKKVWWQSIETSVLGQVTRKKELEKRRHPDSGLGGVVLSASPLSPTRAWCWPLVRFRDSSRRAVPILLVTFSYQDCASSREGEGEGEKFLRRKNITGG